MFTGIITGVGRIAAVRDLGASREHGKRITVEAPAGYLEDAALGDSIALNGACMTVTTLDPARSAFTVDVSAESLDKTSGLDQAGPINLEKALRANDRLGGHIVSGHVDGIGAVTRFEPVGESHELRILAPAALGKYLAYKGSVAVNGVSLTVNSVQDSAQGCELSINLIPHTVHNTALHALRPGSRVNLEIDLIARYVERMLGAGVQAQGGARMKAGAAIAPVEEIVAELKAGRMVILVDEEDRENEGDLVLAADHVTPEAINFMARYGRGLICLTLTRDRCERLHLPPMVARNGTKMGTAFTVSIEAAEGVTTGISAADRACTVQAAVARDARPENLVQPGHVFPLQAVDGGVLMRAGHTEAGCDLAGIAGLTPAAVICEVMKDDGTMARLPDLQVFAAEHGLKIGTIADLIEYRSRTESLVRKVGSRDLQTPWGRFTAHAWQDQPSQGLHLALVMGDWSPDEAIPVRVHEPLSLLDALETGRSMHSWSLDASLQHIARAGKGVAVLLNCGESAEQLLAQFEGTARSAQAPERGGRVDLRTYGIGAQILRDCGVQRMALLGKPRRLPSMAGYGLEITGHLTPEPR